MDQLNIAVNGCNDPKPYDQVSRRAWTFRSLGYGHDVKTWKDIVSALRLVNYDYVISIEHEDALMSVPEGLANSLSSPHIPSEGIKVMRAPFNLSTRADSGQRRSAQIRIPIFPHGVSKTGNT